MFQNENTLSLNCVTVQIIFQFYTVLQGFASGSLDADASSVRMFAARGLELLVAQSYSKNLGLYAERIGAINVVCSSADAAARYNPPPPYMELGLLQLEFCVRANKMFML